MENLRKNKGITLIALIITIIVLLILAGVTISMVVGDNGILSQAGKAKVETEKSDEKDRLGIAYSSVKTEKLGGTVRAEDLNDEFLTEGLDATAEGENPIIVTFNQSGRIYKIKDGLIKEIEKVYIHPDEDKWEYTINESTNTATITKCNIIGATEVTIPNYVKTDSGEIPVSKLSTDWLDGVKSIWSDTSTATGYAPSKWDVNYPKQETITKIIVSEGIEELEGPVFAGTENLKEIILPDTLKKFSGSGLFAWCSNLNNVVIPNNVTNISDSTFWYCVNLTEITIPDNVTELESDVFYNCNRLTNIVIPKKIIAIGNYAFNSCSQLQNVYYKGTQAKWNTISIGSNNTALTSATIHYNYGK